MNDHNYKHKNNSFCLSYQNHYYSSINNIKLFSTSNKSSVRDNYYSANNLFKKNNQKII